jgi:hypothetical protein
MIYQVHHKFCLAVVFAGLLGVSGCSNQPTEQAANQPQTAPVKKAAPPKPVAAAPKPEPKPIAMVTLPKGTAINATLGQTLTSKKNKVGDTFAATLKAPVTVDKNTIIPKGAKLEGKIVAIKKHDIKVALASVSLKGKSYPLETNSITGPAKAQVQNAKATDAKASDVVVLAAKTSLTFKLAKAASVPAPAPAKKPAKTAKATTKPTKKASS